MMTDLITGYAKILRDFRVPSKNIAEFTAQARALKQAGKSNIAIDNLFRRYRDEQFR